MTTRREFIQHIAAGGALAGLGLGLGGCERLSEEIASAIFPAEQIIPRPPSGTEVDLLTHVLNRLTFGPRPEDRAWLERQGVDAFIEQQLAPGQIDDRLCAWRVAELETMAVPRGELYEYPPELILNDLGRAKVIRAVSSKRQLQEVMVEFWSDHLNIAIAKGECRWMKLADDREVIQPHALGSFRDVIRASATSPAMLIYLDGLDNKILHPEDRPNENYARELLELHTLGVHGGYTQRDVMEAARCLSGWTFTHDWRRYFTARVAFEKSRHDDGEKELLGVRIPAGGGADDLERLIDIVAHHESTATHIATKLCRTFIEDSPPTAAVGAVADEFRRSRGDLPSTLRVLFATPEFRSSRGTLFKRPMRFVVSALRALDARTDAGEPILATLRRMGHAPFQYPTPDGYPQEAEPWYGTLLWRWNFAIALAHNSLPGTRIDAPALIDRFGSTDAFARHLLGRSPNPLEREALTLTHASAPLDALALTLASPAFQWQ